MTDADVRAFYDSPKWRKTRREVLAADRNECQFCKTSGRYTKATHVHHVNHLRVHPELALEKFYVDDYGEKRRNLVSTCKDCHETVCHPERLRRPRAPLTPERW